MLTPSRIWRQALPGGGCVTDAGNTFEVHRGAYRILRCRREITPVSVLGPTPQERWLDPTPVPHRAGSAAIHSEGRSCDLGIIVTGGELSRLFGDGRRVMESKSADRDEDLRQAGSQGCDE